MNDDDVKKIIDDTVSSTVIKLKMAGLMKDNKKSAYRKIEELLRNYETFKKSDQPYTIKLVKEIDAALMDIAGDPYYEILHLTYNEHATREYLAGYFDTTVTTISRNKNRLLNVLKSRLFSDDVIYELFL